MELRLPQEVGRRIRALRKQRGWTQIELGKRCGYQQSYIGQIERGEQNITLITLEQILLALEVSPAKLFQEK